MVPRGGLDTARSGCGDLGARAASPGCCSKGLGLLTTAPPSVGSSQGTCKGALFIPFGFIMLQCVSPPTVTRGHILLGLWESWCAGTRPGPGCDSCLPTCSGRALRGWVSVDRCLPSLGVGGLLGTCQQMGRRACLRRSAFQTDLPASRHTACVLKFLMRSTGGW